MIALLKKEIVSFFSSFVGLTASLIFLTVIGVFLWIFPSEFNIPASGLASLDPMFILAPWVFLFFIPAITMRMFAEEKREGTLELLMTKPLTEWQIVLGKFLASVAIIILVLVPLLVYFVVVQYFLSNHNVDTGAFWGGYIGLVFLGAVFASIGLFSSSLSSNQIVAFLLAVVIILFLYLGFDLMSHISFLRGIDQILAYIGIQSHYQSMSKGVIDTRDIIYFLSVIVFFLYFTTLILKYRK